MEKSLIHSVVPFPSSHETSVIAEPSVGAFNLPATFVTPKSPSILKLYSFVLPGRSHELDAPFFQSCSKCVRIVSFVTHQMFGYFSKLIDCLLNKRYLKIDVFKQCPSRMFRYRILGKSRYIKNRIKGQFWGCTYERNTI